jgi:Cu/Ag efflux protein CusF
MQLRELSKETKQEAMMVHQKQLQAERTIAKMSLTISTLETSLQEAEKNGFSASATSEQSMKEDEMVKRVQLLSEEVVRLHDKIAGHTSESLAMKHRLKAAVDKANKLEEELATSKSSQNGDCFAYDSIERTQIARRRKPGFNANAGTIRSAMRLDASGGEKSHQIGRAIDWVDSFASSTGNLFHVSALIVHTLSHVDLFLAGIYLRRNPFARAGFIFYLIMIHFWSTVVFFFHAHSFHENVDFGSGVSVSLGPHALLMQHQPLNPSIGASLNASGGLSVPKIKVTQELDVTRIDVKSGDRSMQVIGVEKDVDGEGHAGDGFGLEEEDSAIVDGRGDRHV